MYKVGLAIDIIPEKGGQCSFYCRFPLKSRFLLYFETKKQVVFDTTEKEPEETSWKAESEEEMESLISPKRDSRQDLIRQATALYEQGNYSRAALVFLKLKGEYELEGEYRAALCYLADKKSRFSRGLAKTWLKALAKEDYKDAGDIYEREFGALKRKE